MTTAIEVAPHASFQIAAPTGDVATIPHDLSEDFKYFDLSQSSQLRSYYLQNGYAVIRDAISSDLCDAARAAFGAEVKPYQGFLYRQTTGNPEKNSFSAHSFVLNPILNIQSLPDAIFPKLRKHGLQILAHPSLQTLCNILFSEPGKVVQSMYFEGNPTTWAHQDTYYLDAEKLGTMFGCWIALEDIAPGAGRFYVYPGSHLIDMTKNGGDFDIAFNHLRYKSLILDVVRKHQLPCRAPALRKGDILIWGAKTIHGSLETKDPQLSRSSITAHFIPESQRFIQFQSRIKSLKLRRVNNVQMHIPKDLSSAGNRMVLWAETEFPRCFALAKRLAIKAITR
jgi:phytanoyl-CoA hydroxylase